MFRCAEDSINSWRFLYFPEDYWRLFGILRDSLTEPKSERNFHQHSTISKWSWFSNISSGSSSHVGRPALAGKFPQLRLIGVDCAVDWNQDLDATRRKHLRDMPIVDNQARVISIEPAWWNHLRAVRHLYPLCTRAGSRPAERRREMVIQPAERSAMDPLCLQQNGRILGESNIIFAFRGVKVRQISSIRDNPKIAQITYIFLVSVCPISLVSRAST